MELITCSGLDLGYDHRRVARQISFTVEAGSRLWIVGENGSGKSTLMKTLLGLLPPLAGSVTLGAGLRRNEIGYLPQQTPVQRDFPASVQEVVQSGCLGRCGWRPFYSRAEKALAARTMEQLGIGSLARRCYRELSGGQQQRVLLARALCATRKLLLLDEPAAGLDPNVTAGLYDLIEDLNRREGITVVMISHDLTAAAARATQILHLGEGRVLFSGPAADYPASPAGRLFFPPKGGDFA